MKLEHRQTHKQDKGRQRQWKKNCTLYEEIVLYSISYYISVHMKHICSYILLTILLYYNIREIYNSSFMI